MSNAPAVWLTESDVADVLDLKTAIDAVADAFVLQRQERAHDMAKTHVRWDHHTLHALGAAIEGSDVVGVKAWAHTSGGAEPLLLLWSATTGHLLAVIEAFALGQLRTSAVAGLATRQRARPDADTLAIVGTGKQALGQVAAVAAVRPLTTVRVFSPTPAHRRAFADIIREYAPALTVDVADSVDEAVHGAHIVTTVTRATTPFLTDPAVLADGVLVNAIGAITPERAELGPDVVRSFDRIVTDNVQVARELASELNILDGGAWKNVASLADVNSSSGPGGGRTLFKAMGVGLADVGLGIRILDAAMAGGRGQPLPDRKPASPRLFPAATPGQTQTG